VTSAYLPPVLYTESSTLKIPQLHTLPEMKVEKEMHDNIRETLAFSCKLLVSQCLRRESNHSGLASVKIAVLEALSRSNGYKLLFWTLV
jgi:hypothetical protein